MFILMHKNNFACNSPPRILRENRSVLNKERNHGSPAPAQL